MRRYLVPGVPSNTVRLSLNAKASYLGDGLFPVGQILRSNPTGYRAIRLNSKKKNSGHMYPKDHFTTGTDQS